MKKTLLTLAIVAISVVTFAQKHNIVNASIALRNENFVEAKQYIDEAYKMKAHQMKLRCGITVQRFI